MEPEQSRVEALSQAVKCVMHMGGTASDVVEAARKFYDFLSGDTASEEAPKRARSGGAEIPF